MDYEILINGNKISIAGVQDIQIADRHGAKSDDIKLVILNNSMLNIQENDSLECNFGGFKSGKMHIDRVQSDTTTTIVGAISVPIGAKEPRVRQWNKVRFFDIVNDIAIRYGLSVFYMGVTNHSYESKTQFQVSDLAFLNKICIQEGYSLKIDNERLVIYNNELLESAPIVKEIGFNDIINNRIVFAENPNKVKSVTVKYFADRLISYTASKGNIGNHEVITEYVANDAEAERYAKGYLNAMRENDVTADMLISINDGISAGNCVELKDYGRYNGKYFVVECYHNPDKDQTRIIGRRIL